MKCGGINNSDLVSVNYEQGGIYSDLNNYSYVTYSPTTDFLLVGKDETGEEKVTITATHANTGAESSFEVTTKTLKNQLYMFQFNPPVKTDVIYTNGKGVKRTLSTNDKGELAVYEPDGIAGSVMTMSRNDGKTYVGTLFQSDLQTGEQDVASLQLYPCNNMRLREISNATLTFLNPDGTKYNGAVTIRGGVYKNDVYCPDAKIRLTENGAELDGRSDIKATVKDGKLELHLDPTQFKNDPNNNVEEYGGAQPGDNITYVFEYRFADSYLPGYVMLNAATDLEGDSSPSDAVVNMKKLRNDGDENHENNVNLPQIIRQTFRQYFDGQPEPTTSNVIDYTMNIGISNRFNKADLYTDVALPNEHTTPDERGYLSYSGDTVTRLELRDKNTNKKLTGQVENNQTTADQIIQLSDLEQSTLFVFPFSSMPISRNIYTMTDSDMKKDGLTDQGSYPHPSTAVQAVFVRNGNSIVKYENLPFGVTNLSNQRDLTSSNGGVKDVAVSVNDLLATNMNFTDIFKGVDAGEMLEKGFAFLGGTVFSAMKSAIDVLIVPTEDPSVFRVVVILLGDDRVHNSETGFKPFASVGDTNLIDDTDPNSFNGNEQSDDGFGLNTGYLTSNAFRKIGGKDWDVWGSKADITVKDKKGKKTTSEGGLTDSFGKGFQGRKVISPVPYGTLVFDASIGKPFGNKWNLDVRGGSVGVNADLGYEWTNNFFVGPVPCNVVLGIIGEIDAEVRFADKTHEMALLVDFGVGITLKAFAGIGVDFSCIVAKIGVFGEVGAYYNLHYLYDPNYQDLNDMESLNNPGQLSTTGKYKEKCMAIRLT